MNGRSESLVVETTQLALRLDKFLQRQFPDVTRVALQRLIDAGEVLLDGRPAKPSQTPRAGQVISIHWPATQPDTAIAEAIALHVLYEDDHLLVINKSSGMVVHPAAGHATGTLVNALLHHCAGRLSGVGGVARPGIVHRLDKDTSGCLIAAKDDATHVALSQQFAQRSMLKIYHAILCGCPTKATGTIQTAIARHPTQRKKMAVVATARGGAKGRAAETSYRVLARLPHASLVEATLHTGRTHQIRVHFQHIGCPVAGDTVYGGRPAQRLPIEQAVAKLQRQMLHAYALTFVHPQTRQPMTLTAPWPVDFQAAWTALGGSHISL